MPGDLYEDCRGGFGGYVWNKKLFSDPLAFQEWVHSVGMELTLNIHDQVRLGEWVFSHACYPFIERNRVISCDLFSMTVIQHC